MYSNCLAHFNQAISTSSKNLLV